MWTLGVYIGLPVTIVVLVVSGIFAYVQRDEFGIAVMGWIVFVTVLGIALWQFFPYTPDYHRYKPVSGTVAEISSRILGNGDSVDQKFVVVFQGNPQEYGCLDTRCALVKIGDRLSLKCLKKWEYAGTPGYDCNFVRNDH